MLLFFSLLMAQLEIKVTQQIDLRRYEVSSLKGYAVSPEGQICMFDGDDSALVFVSSAGKVVARKGGTGQGPGEFQYFATVDWLVDEKIFVTLDWGNQKLMTWKPDGTMIAEFKTPMPMIGGDCAFTHKMLIFSDATMGALVKPLINVFDYGKQKNTKIYEHAMTPAKLPRRSNGGLFVPPWQARLLFCTTKDALAVTFTSDNTVQLLDLSGRSKGKFKVEMKRFPIREEQVKEALERLTPDEGSRIRKELQLPDSSPNLVAMLSDRQGRLWCFGTRPNPKQPYPIKIFAGEGRLLATSTIEHIPSVLMDDALYFTQQDKDDNEMIVKARYMLKP